MGSSKDYEDRKWLNDRAQELRRSGCNPKTDDAFFGALIAWVKTVSRSMLLGIHSYVRDQDDLAQDVAIKVLLHFEQLNGEHDFAAWAYRIVQNESRDYHRKAQSDLKTCCSSVDDPDTLIFVESRHSESFRDHAAERIHAEQNIEALLSMLSEKEAEVFRYKLAGYKLAEIAELMGSRQNTVNSLFHRAIKRYGQKCKAKPVPAGKASSGLGLAEKTSSGLG